MRKHNDMKKKEILQSLCEAIDDARSGLLAVGCDRMPYGLIPFFVQRMKKCCPWITRKMVYQRYRLHWRIRTLKRQTLPKVVLSPYLEDESSFSSTEITELMFHARQKILKELCDTIENTKAENLLSDRAPHGYIAYLVKETKHHFPWITRSMINNAYQKLERQKEKEQSLPRVIVTFDDESCMSDLSLPRTLDSDSISTKSTDNFYMDSFNYYEFLALGKNSPSITSAEIIHRESDANSDKPKKNYQPRTSDLEDPISHMALRHEITKLYIQKRKKADQSGKKLEKNALTRLIARIKRKRGLPHVKVNASTIRMRYRRIVPNK